MASYWWYFVCFCQIEIRLRIKLPMFVHHINEYFLTQFKKWKKKTNKQPSTKHIHLDIKLKKVLIYLNLSSDALYPVSI